MDPMKPVCDESNTILPEDGYLETEMVGKRVIICAGEKFKWANGKTGVVKAVKRNSEGINEFLVLIDGMDISKPPYGMVAVPAFGVELIKTLDDPVNHPKHYADGKYECIDYIESNGYNKDGYLFNAIKYISRAGKKDPDKYQEDIQKAIWYLNRKIEKAGRIEPKRVPTKDYIQDKGLENTLPGLALELLEQRNYDLAVKVLQMELNTHNKHSL